MTARKGVPEGFSTLTPHLIVRGAEAAMKFYSKAFGAVETMKMKIPGTDQVMHGEMKIGESHFMLAEENPDWHKQSPQALGGTPVTLGLYVEDCDAAFNKAVSAGCTAIMPPQDMFWGDRYGQVKDPYGFDWSIATNKETVSPEECMRRFGEMMKQGGGCGAAS